MANVESRTVGRLGQAPWPFTETPYNIRALSFFWSPLAERTLFGFVICHGHATYLVRSVGFQDCDPERESSARRSVALESCFRKCEGRNRRAQACRSHPDYAWSFRSCR